MVNMDYESFRMFSDSWGLVYMIAVVIAVFAFIFRPGSKKEYEEAGKIPLKRD